MKSSLHLHKQSKVMEKIRSGVALSLKPAVSDGFKPATMKMKGRVWKLRPVRNRSGAGSLLMCRHV